jgi:hypothetical protein
MPNDHLEAARRGVHGRPRRNVELHGTIEQHSGEIAAGGGAQVLESVAELIECRDRDRHEHLLRIAQLVQRVKTDLDVRGRAKHRLDGVEHEAEHVTDDLVVSPSRLRSHATDGPVASDPRLQGIVKNSCRS